MSDQAPAEQVDTPTPADTSIEETGTSQQTADQNWEARYKEAQSWGTRLAQEKAQLEQQAQLAQALQSDDPELRRQAAQALGFEFADEQASDDPDPSEQLTQRLSALEQQLQTQAQEAQQAQQLAQIEAHVEAQLDALDGLNERQRKYVVNTAIAMPPTQDGMPDIRGAYDQWIADMNEEKQEWASTKRTSHRVSPVGGEGTQAPNLDKHQDRVDYMQARLQND